MLAIVNGVQTDRKLVAVCEWRTYDVLGNAKDGYEVNDSYNQGEIRIPAKMVIHNVPRLPGASDAYRIFPNHNSFECNVTVVFTIDDEQIRLALGIDCPIETGGDDTMITIDRESDECPLAQIEVIRYEEIESV